MDRRVTSHYGLNGHYDTKEYKSGYRTTVGSFDLF